MKLYATVTTTRGKRKGVGDNTRILVELVHGNDILGTIGLYNIVDDKVEGYNVVWRSDDTPTTGQVLKELETGKKQKDEYICETEGCINKAIGKGSICTDCIPF